MAQALPDPLAAFRLDGEAAIVTGGASGIGRAAAEAFAAVGAAVSILDRESDAAASAAAAITAAGGKARAWTLDVADEVAVERVFREVADAFGRIDVLVNSAGMSVRRPTAELSRAEWDRVVAVNMTGVFLCSQAAAKDMLSRGTRGRIINLASIMGLSGGGIYPNISYQATKGAVVNMTKALAVEWARQGIRVNAVAPTWVRTPFITGLIERPGVMAEIERVTPLGRLAETEEMVGAILFLATRASAMVTGHILPVDGGFLAQ
jgi:NAD(P)-dependent dehydrogenase (short-subunit alcohol dehydrogenase family)